MTDRSATVRIRPELAAGLEELAKATGRSASELAEEALAEYLDYQRGAGAPAGAAPARRQARGGSRVRASW